jgi:amino acid transporter/mannitol/fructose-specific phosphotransferase system IIA component (Ntr-type)
MGVKDKFSCLKRELGLLDIFCIASGAMISSGLFVLPGIAYNKTGSSVIVAYIIASLLIIPTLFSKIELTTAMPKCGGDYFFIDRSMGPMMGTIGGFASWFSLASKTAFALVGIGVFVQLFNTGLSDFNIKLIAIAFCIIFMIINLRGVKHVGKTQVILVIGLLSLLLLYVFVGLFFIESSRFDPFIREGLGIGAIFSTAGFVFVSFMGLTKVCSVAEEVKNPKRNIPLGMFLAWGCISALYALVIFVTVGLLDHTDLINSNMPVSLGAQQFLGEFGLIVMAIAAVLAFITTANAGLLSASRYPMAMSKDHLVPGFFSKMSKNGVPWISIFFTSAFMISIILFLDIEGLVKTASTLVLLLFIFINLSLIMMRESKIRNYRPSFRSPLYPWVQIAGIAGYSFLIFEMGNIHLLFVVCFICLGFGWYWFFARDKIWREYSLLHVIERITGYRKTGYLIDEELREIIIERDNLEEKRFEKLIMECDVIDLYKYVRPDKFNLQIAEKLTGRLNIKIDKLYNLLKKREKDSSAIVHPGISIISNMIRGRDKFAIILVRSRMGIILSDNIDPVHAFFVIVSSSDQKNFYLHSLMWMIQIAEEPDFEKEWINAQDEEDLREVILKAFRKRESLE